MEQDDCPREPYSILPLFVLPSMLHAVDWLPTLVEAAGGQPPEGLDGVSQWKALTSATLSAREEFVYNLDDFVIPNCGHAAIRVGKYKLIDGYPGLYDGWYLPMNDSRDTQLYRNVYQPGDRQPVYLFDVEADPAKREDLSSEKPEVVKTLRQRLQCYRKQMVPAMYPPPDPASDPEKFGGVWSPGWC